MNGAKRSEQRNRKHSPEHRGKHKIRNTQGHMRVLGKNNHEGHL